MFTTFDHMDWRTTYLMFISHTVIANVCVVGVSWTTCIFSEWERHTELETSWWPKPSLGVCLAVLFVVFFFLFVFVTF